MPGSRPLKGSISPFERTCWTEPEPPARYHARVNLLRAIRIADFGESDLYKYFTDRALGNEVREADTGGYRTTSPKLRPVNHRIPFFCD